MYFKEYLKQCRKKAALTQEQLVHELYIHDIDIFSALETTTLSKWERGVVTPHVAKQVSMIRFFQKLTKCALPCFEEQPVYDIEASICREGIHNLLGKSKKLILDFPSAVIGVNDLVVYPLRHSPDIDKYLSINIDLDRDFNRNITGLEISHFKAWALNPANQFYICEYNEQFFGLLFTLKLTPEAFEKIIHFELSESALTENDFASFDEPGCSYIISFFAMNEKAASILFIRYYAHLIANQNSIGKVGVMTMMDDGRKLISNMNLVLEQETILNDGAVLESYQSDLYDFLAHERAMKILFKKEGVVC